MARQGGKELNNPRMKASCGMLAVSVRNNKI